MIDPKFISLIKSQDYEGAEAFIKELSQSKSLEDWRLLLYQAAVDLARKRLSEAESKLIIAEGTANRGWEVPLALTRLYMQIANQQRARFFAEKAYQENPKRGEILLALMHTLLDISDYKRVLELFDRHRSDIKLTKPFTLAAASAFRASGEQTKALKLIAALLEKDPKDRTALRLEADCEADLDSTRGLMAYKKAIEIQKERYKKLDIATCWNASLHFLRHREFERGWEYWEMGFGREVGTMARKIPEQTETLRRIKLSDVINPDIWTIIVPEQGIGDQILFLTGLKNLIKENRKLLLIADQRLKPLLKRSFPELPVAYPGILDGVSHQLGLSIQGYLPYGSILPRLRPSVESFKLNRDVFLTPDHYKRNDYRQKIKERRPGKKIVGISWKGGFWETQQKNKGLAIREWVTALRNTDVTFVSLQYGDVNKDKEFLAEAGSRLIFFEGIDFKQDIDSWSALIAACDGVFSISTALVHFSSAMGIPTHIIMPNPAGPWILGMDDEDHIAYPNCKISRLEKSTLPSTFINRELEKFCARL